MFVFTNDADSHQTSNLDTGCQWNSSVAIAARYDASNGCKMQWTQTPHAVPPHSTVIKIHPRDCVVEPERRVSQREKDLISVFSLSDSDGVFSAPEIQMNAGREKSVEKLLNFLLIIEKVFREFSSIIASYLII